MSARALTNRMPVGAIVPSSITDPSKAARRSERAVERFGVVGLPPLQGDRWASLAAIRTAVGSSGQIILLPGAWTFTGNTAFLVRPVSGTGLELIPSSAGSMTFTEEMLFVSDADATVPSPPAWTPLGDSNLVGWFEYDPLYLPGGFTLAGGAVSELIDNNGSGKKLTQATSAKRPTPLVGGCPSGLPCLQFDHTLGQYLQGTFALAAPYEVYMAFEPRPVALTTAYYFDGVSGTDGCYTTAASHGMNNVVMFVYGGAGGGNATVGRTWELWECCFNGASSKFKINAIDTSGNLADNSPAPGGFTLGAAFNGTLPADMHFKAALIYSGAQKIGAARTNIETYLKTKAGIVW